MAHAFITWDAALGRRMCPLATFGSRAPLVHRARLVCVDPPRADRPSLSNADAVRGAIALVVRGGCSFLDKARRIQQAGAVAMILANNTREEPFTMFTMAADSVEATASAEPAEAGDDIPIQIPCAMMCLYDVRELFKQYPPSVQTGVLTFEIHAAARELELVAECEAARLLAMQQHDARDGSGTTATQDESSSGGGWGAAFKRKTSSLIKRWEAPVAPVDSPRAVPSTGTPSTGSCSSPTPKSIGASVAPPPAAVSSRAACELEPKQPVFAFVQWAVSASEYVLFFAPLSDFCLVASHAVYEGRRVVCDPLLAHEEVIRNGAELVDAIALVQRGACTFPAKLERIQRCGAAAAIVGNDDATHDDAAFVMSVDHIKVDHVTIPSVMVSRRVFQRLIETDCPTQLRILCLSGEAAAECLSRAGGRSIPIREIQTPENTDPEDPLTRLHAACRAGDHGACQRVLDECCDDDRARRELVLARDPFQLTALHHACAASDSSPHHAAGADHIVALLLRLGAQVTARDAALNSPLHFACLHGHAACVKRLLAASINSQELTAARNLGGATPIHYAAMAGSTACVELLLSVNARRVDGGDKYCFDGVDTQDEDGATPLHVATAATHVDCVLYLAAANADYSVRDRHGRTALQIACALVNEPSQSLQALLIVEKLMDAGAPVVLVEHETEGGGKSRTAPLAIDCIASKAIKRELEIAFLRREATQSREACRGLTQQLASHQHQLQTLQDALATAAQRHEAAQRVASERERERRIARQQRQIDQLQLQMKTLLTVLHSGRDSAGGSAGAALSTHVLADAATATSPGAYELEEDSLEAESVRAQDAALARDLGKKCCRERQFALAQTYFERSLEVFPLPGVARLLAETKTLRHAAESRGTLIDGKAIGHSTGKSDKDTEDDGKRLRRLVADLTASQSTKEALAREVAKLEVMDRRSADYGAALKWIEWLLALPWASNQDGESGRASPRELLALEAALFDEIERMENESLRRRQHYAARAIQRTFRERYAVHLLQRAMASAQIQRVYRRHRQRRDQQRRVALAITRNRQRGAEENLDCSTLRGEDDLDEATETADTADDGELEEADERDVSTTVDPRAPRNRMRVVRGERLESAAQYVVLQLLASDPVVRRSLASSRKDQPDAPLFHVWKRWGATREDARQTTLSGPYEELETATVRYERLLRESQLASSRGTKQEETTSKGQEAPVVTAAWTWLRASSS